MVALKSWIEAEKSTEAVPFSRPGARPPSAKNRVGNFFSASPDCAGQTTTQVVEGDWELTFFLYDSPRSASLSQSKQTGYRTGLERPWYTRAWESVEGGLKGAYTKATGWHFEGRLTRNRSRPTHGEARDPDHGWRKMPPEEAIFHDNKVGSPEEKYIHPGGREAVFSSDQTGTYQPYTDPRYMGTYNYINPAPKGDSLTDVDGWLNWGVKGAGHVAVDVVPYWFGGNVRGEEEEEEEEED